jgi:hypothetical protein
LLAAGFVAFATFGAFTDLFSFDISEGFSQAANSNEQLKLKIIANFFIINTFPT